MMDSTHGATNPFAGVPESASLSQTAYVDADAPPEEGEESAYVSFTVAPQPQTSSAFHRELHAIVQPIVCLVRCVRLTTAPPLLLSPPPS